MSKSTVALEIAPVADVVSLLAPSQVRRYRAVPIRRSLKELVVAMSDPGDLAAIQEIEFLTGLRLRPVGVTSDAILDAIERHYPPDSACPVPSAETSREPSSDSPVVDLQRAMFREAIRVDASDIHIDPLAESSRIRFRVDGVMRDGFEIPRWLHGRLVARFKVIAGLDTSERRRPQDGHLTDSAEGFEARLSTLPSFSGEALVLRIFRDRDGMPALDDLGCDPALQDQLLAMGARAQGILLVAGPTGSGKTTTLYAIVNALRRRPRNIVTIEDPVEYRVNGLRQVQVDERRGLTFQSALRSTLRQDPDVILVGEIRDSETARTAFHAGMTGHLVLSTVHATEAVGVLARLAELGIEIGLVRSALIGVVAQRLLPANCPDCLEADRPPAYMLRQMGIDAADFVRLRKSRGCPACGHSGTRGRRPVFEVLEFDGNVARCLAGDRYEDLADRARASGFVPMATRATEHVLAGDVAFEEAYRACYFGRSA